MGHKNFIFIVLIVGVLFSLSTVYANDVNDTFLNQNDNLNNFTQIEDCNDQDIENLEANSLPTKIETYETEIVVKEYEENYRGTSLIKDLRINVYSNMTNDNGKKENVPAGNITLEFNKKTKNFEIPSHEFSFEIQAPKVGEYSYKLTYQGYTKQTTYPDYVLKEIYKPSSISFKLVFEHKPYVILYTKDIRARRGDDVNISARITSSKEYYDFGRIVVKIDDVEYNLTKSTNYTVYNNFYTYNVSGICRFNTLYTKQYSLFCYPYNDYKNNSVKFRATIKPKLSSLEVNVTNNNLILGDYSTKLDIKVNNFETDSFGKYYLFIQKPPFEQVNVYYYDYSLILDENNMTSTTITTMTLGLNNYRVYFTNRADHVFYYFNVTLTQKTNIVVNTISAQHNSNTKLVAHVKNNLNENINEGFISFIIDGKTYVADVISGEATVNLKMPSKVGTLNYIVKYTPNSRYTSESSSILKIISKYGTKISVKSVTGYQGKKVKLKAIVKDDMGRKLKKGTVYFTINGKTYSAKVKNGVATIKIKYPKAKYWDYDHKVKRGYLYKIKYYKSIIKCKVQFKKNGNYLGSSSNFKVTSKKKPVVKKYRIKSTSASKSKTNSKSKSSTSSGSSGIPILKNYYTFWFKYDGNTLGNMPVTYKIYSGSYCYENDGQTDALGFIDISPIPLGSHKIYIEGKYLLSNKIYHSTFTVYRVK